MKPVYFQVLFRNSYLSFLGITISLILLVIIFVSQLLTFNFLRPSQFIELLKALMGMTALISFYAR